MGAGLAHCRELVIVRCEGRGGPDRRPLRICWRVGERGKAVLSICRVLVLFFGVAAGAREQGAERVVGRGGAKRGGSGAACFAGKGGGGWSGRRINPHAAPGVPGPGGRNFSVQRFAETCKLRPLCAETRRRQDWKLEIFDPGV